MADRLLLPTYKRMHDCILIFNLCLNYVHMLPIQTAKINPLVGLLLA